MMVLVLTKELNTFDENRERLLASNEGDWVLVSGHKIFGVFSAYEDALQQGYKTCGDDYFLVKQILRIDEPILYLHGVG